MLHHIFKTKEDKLNLPSLWGTLRQQNGGKKSPVLLGTALSLVSKS